MFVAVTHQQRATWITWEQRGYIRLLGISFERKLMISPWHESCFPLPAHNMFCVILDARYFILLHWSSVRMGTWTCCTMPGRVPPSEVRPQPTAVPMRPCGSLLSFGKHTGLMVLVNTTGLRSFNNAMSWLYEFWSKLRCRIMALTARIIACVSDATNWSWSPNMTRILLRFNLLRKGIYLDDVDDDDVEVAVRV